MGEFQTVPLTNKSTDPGPPYADADWFNRVDSGVLAAHQEINALAETVGTYDAVIGALGNDMDQLGSDVGMLSTAVGDNTDAITALDTRIDTLENTPAGSMAAADILTALKTVDTDTSGLNAQYVGSTALSGLQLRSEKDSANGYAGLDVNSRIAPARMGSGVADGTAVLYGDGVFRPPIDESRNFVMQGGGTLSWGVVTNKFKTTDRFFMSPVHVAVAAARYLGVGGSGTGFPTSGVTDAAGAERASADGITINAHEVLWAIYNRPAGGATLRVVPFDNVLMDTFTYDPEAHVLAVRYTDSNLYLRNGVVLNHGESLIDGGAPGSNFLRQSTYKQRGKTEWTISGDLSPGPIVSPFKVVVHLPAGVASATLEVCKASLGTVSTSGDVTVDITKGGTSLWHTTPLNKPILPANGADTDVTTAFDTTTVADGDVLVCSVPGLGTGAKNLWVMLGWVY